MFKIRTLGLLRANTLHPCLDQTAAQATTQSARGFACVDVKMTLPGEQNLGVPEKGE